MTGRVRTAVALGILGVIVVWPMVHISLSTLHHLNPWKLGGWGMYSDVQPSELGLKVLLIESRDDVPDSLGPLLGDTRIVHLTEGGPREIEIASIPIERLRELSGIARRLRVLGHESHKAAFLAGLKDHAEESFDTEIWRALLLVSKPRLSLLKQTTYTETVVYCWTGERLESLGHFDSLQTTEAKLVDALDAIRLARPKSLC